MGSPVEGLRPLRCFLSFTQNLPNLLIRTSSPDARAFFMIARRLSTVSVDCFFENPFLLPIALIIRALVSAMAATPQLHFIVV